MGKALWVPDGSQQMLMERGKGNSSKRCHVSKKNHASGVAIVNCCFCGDRLFSVGAENFK